MNLRGLANSMTKQVNPNIPITVKISNGYTIDPVTLRQVPVYTEYEAVGNVQALDGDDITQISNLNQAGVIRAVYLYGSVSGVIRADSTSVSNLTFVTNESGVTKARSWNVFKVLETWPQWCKVAVVYVGDD